MNTLRSFFQLTVLILMTFLVFNCEKKEEDSSDRVEPVRVDETFTLQSGSTVMLDLNEAANTLVNIVSRLNQAVVVNVEVVADNDGTTRTFERTLEPGEAFAEEFPLLVSVVAVVPVGTAAVVGEIDFESISEPVGGNGFSPSDWLYAGKVCVEGEVKNEPDQNIDCLWEKETLWQAVTKRDIELTINLTGKHDMKVELEGPPGIFQSYNMYAEPALPNNQVLQGEWEGIVAIHYLCMKSPVHNCESCDFTYDLCYE